MATGASGEATGTSGWLIVGAGCGAARAAGAEGATGIKPAASAGLVRDCLGIVRTGVAGVMWGRNRTISPGEGLAIGRFQPKGGGRNGALPGIVATCATGAVGLRLAD